MESAYLHLIETCAMEQLHRVKLDTVGLGASLFDLRPTSPAKPDKEGPNSNAGPRPLAKPRDGKNIRKRGYPPEPGLIG
ncbi:unnamed protein product [Linum trigynum]|uniref:Uncharacterized protein n=1 Tax=Linum trigynum TaxID=586398 RepID=A0AAV2EF26_9ROSI